MRNIKIDRLKLKIKKLNNEYESIQEYAEGMYEIYNYLGYTDLSKAIKYGITQCDIVEKYTSDLKFLSVLCTTLNRIFLEKIEEDFGFYAYTDIKEIIYH